MYTDWASIIVPGTVLDFGDTEVKKSKRCHQRVYVLVQEDSQ